MAISVKISQLQPGGFIQAQDEIPIARGGLETFKIAASQVVTNASNVGVGSGQIFFNKATIGSGNLQFRSLSGVDNISVVNQGSTLVISASGQNPTKTSITGNGSTTTFALAGANSINPSNYRVDIDGVLQEPITDYTVAGSNIVFATPPPIGGKVTVVSNNLVRVFDTIPSDQSVTTAKIADSNVTTAKIADANVTTAKIADANVTTAKIANLAVTAAKIASNAITSDELASFAVATANIANGAVTTEKIASVTQQSLVPSGAVMAFARNTAPSGWLKCNGAAVSRSTYASLFGAIGTTFGAGNGSTTFNLPELRGEFIRGWADGRGVDTGRGFATTQGDAIRNLTGTFSIHAFSETSSGVFRNTTGGRRQGTPVDNNSGPYTHTFDASRQVPTAGEARPRNVALLYCIKF